MPVDNINVIDFVSLDKDGNVVLTISDHLEWDEKNEHLLVLQDKINAYLGAIEDGSLYKSYPKAENKKIIISIIAKYKPDQAAKIFLDHTGKFLNDAGYTFSFSVLKE